MYQLVADTNAAWANGGVKNPTWQPLIPNVNPNQYTLSIEHEGWPNEPLTDAQYAATLELHAMLCDRWQIPRDRDHIIGHYEIDSVDRPNCPGPLFPWDKLIADLNPPPEQIDPEAVHLRIDGQPVDYEARLIDGKTFVHVRFAEAVGYAVNWNGETRTVELEKKE